MVAIYARQSVDKKDSISIETQIQLCREELAPEAPLRVYQDRGYSGSNTNRPGLRQLLEDVRRREIQRVAVYKLDRISRSLMDFARLVELFREYGVAFQSTQERFDTATPMGNAMLSIAMVFAQLERETIQQRIRDNYYARGRKGMYLGGKPPFGYRKGELRIQGARTGVLEPDPGELSLVKGIFSAWADGGRSLGEICRELNGRQSGRRFQPSALSRMLRNPVYVRADPDVRAYFAEQGCQPTNPPEEFLGRNGCYLYGKQPWSLTLAPHEGCIPAEQWLRAQTRLGSAAASAPVRSGTGGLSWLSGLVRCGFCQSPMSVKTAANRDGHTGEVRARYAYLSCNGRRTGLCRVPLPRHGMALEPVEAAVEKRLLRFAASGRIPAYCPPSLPAPEEGAARAELASTMEAIRRLVEAVKEGGAMTGRYLEGELESLDRLRQAQELRLHELAPPPAPGVTPGELMAGWAGFPVSLKRRLAQQFIQEIRLYHSQEGDRMEIRWRWDFREEALQYGFLP